MATPVSIDVPYAQPQSLKKLVAYGGPLYNSFLKMQMYTGSVQKWVGSDSIDAHYPGLECVYGYLASKLFFLMAGEQKSSLILFLEQLGGCMTEVLSTVKSGTTTFVTSREKIQFGEHCQRIKSYAESVLSPQEIHNICAHIIKTMAKGDCFVYLSALLATIDKTQTGTAISTGIKISACDQQRILISNTKKAFLWTYNGEHALAAFLEYLDVQWAKMIQQWDPSQGGTLQSRCGTIVQSSCAGKSRLIDR